MSHNDRLQALKILTQVLEHRSTLAQSLTVHSSPMTKELCFGVCRHYVRLSRIADMLLDKRPKAMEVWVALLMGLYQLHYMALPDYAVVKETVALVEKIKKNWAKGLLNAVLRTFCRTKEELISSLAHDEDFVYGHPPKLLALIKEAWPEDWQAIAKANDLHPPMTLRIQADKIAVADYVHQLAQLGSTAVSHPFIPTAITLAKPCDVRELPGFAKGLIAVQDAAAQLAVPLLNLQPGLRVLDACCAPGGKTCHILESERDLALCLALDVDRTRLQRVEDNLKRQQLTAQIQQGDALQPQQWWNGELFDRILLDAPCSATGVIRRHADIKLLRSREEINTIVATQNKMLRSLWPLLAPQGMMVYATCSIMPCENEQQIALFAEEHEDCRVATIDAVWGRATGHGRQILPGEHGMDGFFYSVLEKAPL